MARNDDTRAQQLQVFISYSRRDMAAADELVAQLESHSIDVLIDRRDLPYGEEWQNELADFIRTSDTVVWLVSPDSVKSRWVNWELGEVARLSKRLIPLRVQEMDPASLPESLGKIHLLPADGLFDIGRHLGLLVDVLNTDLAWLKEATRLADRARQWVAKGRDSGLLLRGRALLDAETWSRSKPRSAPNISGEIFDLILNSRRATARRQKRVVAGALTIAVVGVGLAVFSWLQRNTALINQSTYLAKLSQDQLATGDAGTGLLLAISALPEWRMALDRPLIPQGTRSLNDAVLAIREAKLLVGHGADANTARFSSDDQIILTSSDDGFARLWRASTGEPLQSLGPHAGKVFGAEFSPDNQLIATLTEDNNVYVWNAAGKLLDTLSGHTERVNSLSFDSSTDAIVSASRDATARIWRIKSPAVSTVLRGHKGAVNSAMFSLDSKHVVTASADNSAIVWNVASAQTEKRLRGHTAPVLGAIFDATGLKIATYSEDQTVRIWDTATGNALALLTGHDGPISSIAFCPIGDCLISGGRDGVARIWSAQTGKLRHKLEGHSRPIMKVSIDARGKIAATVARDGLALLWDVETGEKLLTLGGHDGDIFDVAFSHSGEYLVTASRDRTARIWRAPAPTTTQSRINLGASFRSVDLSGDRKFLALGTADGSVRLLDANTLRQLADVSVGKATITLLAFDRAGTRLLVGTADGAIGVYSTPSLAPYFSGSIDGSEISGGGFEERDSGFFVAAVSGATAKSDGTKLRLHDGYSFGACSSILVTTYSPESDRVLVGEMSGAARVVGTRAGRKFIELKGHTGAVQHGVFDRAGKLALTASEDGTARIWDATTGNTLQVLSGHEAPVTFVTISEDGKYVATASTDRTVRLWKRGEPAPIAIYRGHLASVALTRFTHDGSVLNGASPQRVLY